MPDPQGLMLFAAGFGTRMGALTRTRPKPMVEVAGRPLIDRALDLAEVAGVARTVVNLHYLGAVIEAHLASRPGITLAWERERILDTGGGLRAALPLLPPGPVFTLNPDAVWTGPNPLMTLRGEWDGAQMAALLLLAPVEAVTGRVEPRGDFGLDAEGRIARGGPYVYLGAQILDPSGLGEIADEAFSLNVLWDRLIAEGRAFGCLHRGGWCDVGHPAAISLAEAMLAEELMVEPGDPAARDNPAAGPGKASGQGSAKDASRLRAAGDPKTLSGPLARGGSKGGNRADPPPTDGAPPTKGQARDG